MSMSKWSCRGALSLIACLLAAPSAQDDLEILLDGVQAVVAPGTPGDVVALSPDAFVVIAGGVGKELRAPVVAAARHGKGRAAAFGHGGYLRKAALGTADTAAFMTNLTTWLSVARPGGIVSCPADSGLAAMIEKSGRNVTRERRLDDDVALLVIDGGALKTEDADAIEQFVAAGGALMTAATGWGWQQLHPGQTLASDFAGNEVLGRLGLLWGARTVKTTHPRGFEATRSLPATLHAGHALARIASDEQPPAAEGSQIESTLMALLDAGDPDREALVAQLGELLEGRGAALRPRKGGALPPGRVRDRLAVRWVDRLWRQDDPRTPRTLAAAADFPGLPTEDATPVTTLVPFAESTGGRLSTGLYAPPGASIRVRIEGEHESRGLRIWIGCHTDRLWHKERWQRWPAIARAWEMPGETLTVTSPLGGLILLERNGAAERDLEVEISGAIAAPLYVLGRTTIEEWNGMRAGMNAPWGELQGEKIIFSLPRDVLATVEDPASILEWWDRVVAAHEQLAGRSISSRPQRVVCDMQISAGYMHSGYPVMTHLDAAAAIVDLEKLKRQGNWGLFHELGHNSQRREWTFSGTGEVTCNIFTLHAYEKVVGTPAWEHSRVQRAIPKARAYREGEEGFTKWKSDPFLALAMYSELQREFGWQAYYDVFREYEAVSKADRPKSDDDKRDQWLVRMSRTVGRDLSPFFDRWKVPTRETARRSLADLEPFSGE